MIEPALAKDPMLSTLPNDPIDPIDRAEPTEPMLSTELREPIDSRELVEPMLHRDVDDVMPSSCRSANALLGEDRWKTVIRFPSDDDDPAPGDERTGQHQQVRVGIRVDQGEALVAHSP